MDTTRKPAGFLGRLKRAWASLQTMVSSNACSSARRDRHLAPLQELEDRRLLSAAPIGPEFRVNTTTASTQETTVQTPKSVAVAPSGDFIAVWASNGQDGNGWGVYAQRYDAAGVTQGAEFRVNTTTSSDQLNPAIAVDSSGNFVITWSSKQSGNWDVYAQRYAADGTVLGSEFRVNSTTSNDQQDASIAMDASGKFLVTWASKAQDGSGWGVYAQHFNASGVAQGPEFRVNTFTSNDQFDPQAAMAPTGAFVITWTSSNGQDGNGNGVYAQRFNAAGVMQGSEFLVNTYVLNHEENPDVAMDASGNFVITWSSKDQDGDNYGVYAQRYDNAGTPQGGEFQVNTNIDKDQRYSSVAMDANGNFVITWSSKGQDSNDTWGVYARRYLASGTADGSVFRVNSTTGNDQIYSSVGMSMAGNFVIVWSGSGPGDGSGVFAQRYVTAGIVVTPTSGLVTSEDGTTANFTIVLATQPTANVSIGVSSSNTSEGTASVTSLTFTPANWNVAQTVIVTGVDDALADGPVAFTTITAPAVSADTTYNNLNPADVALTNLDNESPGIVVSPASGLVTTEAGGTTVFKVALSTAPTADVTIGINSSNPGEGAVSVSSLTFTPSNWGTGQVVTITGVDDLVADGDIAYTVITAPAVSADLNYVGLDAADVPVTNLNDDFASIAVTPDSGLVTTEGGGQATFSVVLKSQPTANVTLTMNSSNLAEGTISTPSLTFTSANWNVAQTVTITGFDDFAVDGAVAYTIVLDPATSTDPGYDGLDPSDVSVVNLNNDIPPGITISAASPTPLGNEYRVNTTTAGDQWVYYWSVRTVAVAPDGSTVHVWIDTNGADGSQSGIFGQRFDATGNPLGGQFLVNTTTANNQDNASIAMDSNGNFIVLWDSLGDGNGNGIFGQRFLANGTPVGGEFQINTFTLGKQQYPEIDFAADGSFVAAWVSPQGGSGAKTVFQRFDANANKIGGEVELATGSSLAQTLDSLDVKADGSFIVTWTEGDDVYGRLYDANTSPVGAAFQINQYSTDLQQFSVARADAAGNFVVVWESAGQDGFGNGVYGRRFAADGSPLDNEFVIASSTAGDQYGAVLAVDSAGNFVVAWTDGNALDGSAESVLMRRFDASGNRVGGVSQVNQTTAGYQAWPVIGMNNDGEVVVAWEGNGPGDDYGVFARRYQLNPTVVEGNSMIFTVVLDTAPTAAVTLNLSVSDSTEASLNTTTLTFDASNWNTPQSVTLTGVQDGIIDGDVYSLLIASPAISSDVNYNGLDAGDVPILTLDSGVVVLPPSVSAISGPTTEAGGTATFTVVLNAAPSADVTIGLSSSNTAEGTISTNSLTFTPANWNVAQTVTVTGVDDLIVDGNINYTIVTAAATSSDASYNGLDSADVLVVNQDNDASGIIVNPVAGLTTTEAGGAASFTVQLNSLPLLPVTIGISSSNPAEGTVSTSSLTFTVLNWNTPQTITITGVDDFVADGSQSYSIVVAPATSLDLVYSGMDGPDVTVANADNDFAGINVTSISGPTTEAGGTANFSVVLTSQPTANVTVGISSSNTTEGTVSAPSLTFTPANWNTPQTVMVTGVDDVISDGNTAYTIVTAPAVSADANYNSLDAADVAVTNQDNDIAGVNVSTISGPTTEAGGMATFNVVLTSQPTSNVTVGISSSNTIEGTVSAPSLTFTPANWNVAQTVTVTGMDDFIADGNTAYTIVTAPAVSADANYNSFDAADVAVTNLDNDVAGVNVSTISGPTTEAGGAATFNVVLTSQPTATVTIGLSSSNMSEGTVSAPSVTFTPGDWNIAQTVTVTGVDDVIADGNTAYTIITAPAASADADYDSLDAADVAVTNLDNDVAGVTVSAISGPTTEAGGMATFNVVLTSQPTANVTVGISSSNTTEGTVSAPSVTFTPANWNTPQMITVTGVDDFTADGNRTYTIVTAPAVSADANYNSFDAADVAVTNLDNDVAGVNVSAINGPTTEAGGTANFSVVLTSQPTANVTVGISSSNTTEGTVSAPSLTFTPANWNVAQTVSVTGVDDSIADGNTAYTIVTAPAVSADADYDSLDAADVAVSNQDNDVAGVNVSTISGPTTEAGGTANFSVVLTSQPTANVTVGISSSNTSEGTVSVPSVTFTPGDWNIAQTVTVTGVDDFIADGNTAYTIVTAPAVSADANYNSLDAADVVVSNQNDDTAGIQVSPTSGLVTTPGGAASFTVVLTSQPTAGVTITLASSDPSAGNATQSMVAFTPANWNLAQSVTVSSPTGLTTPGDVSFAIYVGPAASSDTAYMGQSGANVTLTLHIATPPPPPVQANPILLIAPVQPPSPANSGGTATNGSNSPGTTSSAALSNPTIIALAPVSVGNASAVPTESAINTGMLAGPSSTARTILAFAPVPRNTWGQMEISNESGSPEALLDFLIPRQMRAAVSSSLVSATPTDDVLDVLNEDGERMPWNESGLDTTMVFGTGVIAASGYVLLNSRLGLWLLGLLTSQPLWKQFDPLEVLYAWEEEEERVKDDQEEETLLSLVDQ